jgi:uncharacterized protein YjiS (DUF1127 family)
LDVSRTPALHSSGLTAIRLPLILGHLLDRIETILAVWRQRRCLAQMDASRLKDIGITAGEAAQEAARPIWDLPVFWRD